MMINIKVLKIYKGNNNNIYKVNNNIYKVNNNLKSKMRKIKER